MPPAPVSVQEKRGFNNSDLLKFRLLNRTQSQFTGDKVNAPNDAERVFKTVSGEWRVRDGDDSKQPVFYPVGADISGTTLFDEQFYQNEGGKWIELSAGGRLCDLPENKGKVRPETVSEFEWRGWREVSQSEVPADYNSEGKTVAFANQELADNQKSVFKRYLVDCNLIKDWDEVLGERLIDAALQKGATIEAVPTGEINSSGKTVYAVEISAESLKILRGEIQAYRHELDLGKQARTKGAQEATNDVSDMFGGVYETVRQGGEMLANVPSDTLNTLFFPSKIPHPPDEPNFGRAKVGEMYDELSANIGETYKGNPFPRLDTSAVKYDFRSEWMRRDLNGKLDGSGIKQGEATTFIAGQIAPLVVGKVFTPVESPQSLK